MAVKYVPYFKEPIEGQAILDNFTRTKRILKYADNDKVNILTPSKYAVEPFKSNGKNVSATDIRNNIDNFKKVKELLPEKLSDKDVKRVMKILGVESIKEDKNHLLQTKLQNYVKLAKI